MSRPPLSVIIPAYNEEVLLGQTIVSLKTALAENGLEGAEIIVANDGSTDRTVEVATENGARVVTVENRQIAATRNAGATVATSDRLLFLDADTILPPGTLKAALAAMDGGAVGCGVSVEFDVQQRILVRLLSWTILKMVWLMGAAAGCCILVTRGVFDTVGGFPEDFYASEELWFCRAVKREGRFTLLSNTVTTSGRKMNYHSTAKILWMIAKISVLGPRALKSRKHLGLWYDGRRG